MLDICRFDCIEHKKNPLLNMFDKIEPTVQQ